MQGWEQERLSRAAWRAPSLRWCCLRTRGPRRPSPGPAYRSECWRRGRRARTRSGLNARLTLGGCCAQNTFGGCPREPATRSVGLFGRRAQTDTRNDWRREEDSVPRSSLDFARDRMRGHRPPSAVATLHRSVASTWARAPFESSSSSQPRIQRREEDSNLRALTGLRFSRPPRSTAPASLQRQSSTGVQTRSSARRAGGRWPHRGRRSAETRRRGSPRTAWAG